MYTPQRSREWPIFILPNTPCWHERRSLPVWYAGSELIFRTGVPHF